MRCHGVLVDVGGVGVLLVGPSGVGKSECALELLSRGHRLVADDVVDLERDGDRVIGRPVETIRHHVEVRGLGILSVPELYGPDAVAEEATIDLVCRLDAGENSSYDRTGLTRAHEELAGVPVPKVTLPARLGANLATLVDAAARDQAQRARGPSAAARFDAGLREQLRRS